jgi:hypothetical protein
MADHSIHPLRQKSSGFGLSRTSPDIKHNRVPAPGISFEQPNLPFLIEEIEREILPSNF